MGQINTTIYRQHVDRPEQEERYKIVSVEEDELYVSMVYTEDGEIENRYEPNHRGWEYGRKINESELPVEHIEELSSVKERLSSTDSVSSEPEVGKAKI